MLHISHGIWSVAKLLQYFRLIQGGIWCWCYLRSHFSSYFRCHAPEGGYSLPGCHTSTCQTLLWIFWDYFGGAFYFLTPAKLVTQLNRTQLAGFSFLLLFIFLTCHNSILCSCDKVKVWCTQYLMLPPVLRLTDHCDAMQALQVWHTTTRAPREPAGQRKHLDEEAKITLKLTEQTKRQTHLRRSVLFITN